MIGPELESAAFHLAPGFLLTRTGYNAKHMRDVERVEFEMNLFAGTSVLIKYKGKRIIVSSSIIKEMVLA